MRPELEMPAPNNFVGFVLAKNAVRAKMFYPHPIT